MSNQFDASGSWTILSPIEQSIKRKIEAVGVPLKEWDVNINYGIKTGFNEAFIIDGQKREELITADPKSAEIIRPILRGRDIKRYSYEFSDLWLINTHNGIAEQDIPPVNINEYPAIKRHLDQYTTALEKRLDKGKTAYHLRSCAYVEDFSKPKIAWADLARSGNAFVLDTQQSVVLNTTYILTSTVLNAQQLMCLLAILNSRITLFYMNTLSSKLDETGWRWFKQFVELLPIPSLVGEQQFCLANLAGEVMAAKANKEDSLQKELLIDKYIFDLLDFSFHERQWIMNGATNDHL